MHFNRKNNSMKKIIACTDFSDVATNAVNYAADMALASNAELIILHTYEYPLSLSEVPIALDISEVKNSADERLLKLKMEISKNAEQELRIKFEALEGNFFSQLKTVCEKIRPYAVVIGTQGKTMAERILLGGHAVYAMKHLEWPIIAVPPNVTFSQIKKIGLACDFEKVVDYTPVNEIKQLVTDFNAQLHLLNTGKKSTYSAELVFQSGLIQEMFFELKPVYHFIENNDIDRGILEFTENNNIDLLIVLPKRHNLIEELLLKSHTRQFVLHSHIPVMALHE
jgi:nucleotide-binding universal stress UspA family protein